MKLYETNPFVRAAEVQKAVLEGECSRVAYDNRLFLILDGEGELILNGSKIPIKRDILVYIGIKDEYYFSGKIKVAVINFDFTLAESSRRIPKCPVPRAIYKEEEVFDRSVAEGYEKAMISVADEDSKALIMRLVKTFIISGNFSDTLCSAYLKQILAQMKLEAINAKDERMLLVERLENYIRNNLPTIQGNAELGEVFGYHPVYLAEIFKSKTGKTLHAFLLSERLALAQRWLLNTNFSVENIAIEVGFSSKSHFCTAFKKAFGITPLKYRDIRQSFIL